ncbi:MAG: NADH-quinone oxidoreductase subunit C, partial [Thermodesulfovibrio sp.]
MAQEVKAIEESLKIAKKLSETFPETVLEINEFRGQVSVTVKKIKIKEVLRYLKEQHGFNHLQDLCGVDHYPA